MADIIDEINEELKQERMQALFAKYGKYVLVFAIFKALGEMSVALKRVVSNS